VNRLLVALALAFALLANVSAATPKAASPQQHSALVPFRTAPFPYHGENPEGKPFFDVQFRGQRGHHSSRGGIYWEKETYSDRRALVVIPPQFDVRKPATLVVFLHGNEATLERDVRVRQQVPQQLARSGLNAVLVAPQLAYDARDSSPGRFWVRGAFAQFLDEAADQAAAVAGDARLKQVLRRAPVVLVAYSGGYYPAAFALSRGGADHRMHGVVLLDALYGQEDKFADWVIRHHHDAFFVSAYTEPARASNESLQDLLRQRKVDFTTELPQRLADNQIHFLSLGPDVVHEDVVTQAWTAQPITDVLRRVAKPAPVQAKQAPVKAKIKSK
jgi:hypothetical protein